MENYADGDAAAIMLMNNVDDNIAPELEEPIAQVPSLENELLRKVFETYRSGDLFRCCTLCFQLLREFPERGSQIKDIFTYSLYLYGVFLGTSNCGDEVVSCYDEALDLYPNDEKLMYHYGYSLFLVEQMDQAMEVLNDLLTINSEHVPARRILSKINNKRFGSKEIAILNQKDKNEYYIKAIKDYIALGFDEALFVNAGICNFAVIAAKNGANITYASEVNDEMIKIAKELMSNYMVHVNIYKKDAMMLDMRDGFRGKPSLLVMDIHKYGTLLEGLMTEVSHLFQHVMRPSIKSELVDETDGNYSVVIPSTIEICCAAIECSDIANNYVYPVYPNLHPMQDRIRMSRFRVFDLGLTQLSTKIYGTQTYESHNLQIMNVKYLTDAKTVFNVNLNDKQDVYRQLYEDNDKGNSIVTIEAKVEGKMHAIAAWFNCKIKSDLIITSNPQVTESGVWKQAIYLLEEPMPVDAGTVINVKCKKINDKIKLCITDLSHPPGSTLDDVIEHPERSPDYICNTEPELFAQRWNVFPCESDMKFVKMFNDAKLIRTLKETARYFVTHATTETTKIRIFDTSPFPLFGFLILLNVKEFMHVPASNVKLCCNMADLEVRNLLEYICMENGLDFRLLFQHLRLDTFAEPCSEKVEPFDVIVLPDIIKPDGDFNERVIGDMPILSACLKTKGYMYPSKVNVVCQLMECNWIEEQSYVTTMRMDDINIPTLVNEHKINHHTGLYLNKVNKKPLSDVFKCASFRSCGILLNEFEDELRIRAISDGVVTVAGYWFDLYYVPGVGAYSTCDNDSSYQQAAFVLDEPIKVSKSEVLLVTFKYHQGHINIKVKKNSESDIRVD